MTSERTFDTQKPLADDWNTFRERVANFNQYAHAADPKLLLRRGLVEEAHEIAIEKGSDVVNKAHLTGEIGDALFYLSHIAKFHGDIEIDVDSAQEIPIYSVENGAIVRINEPMDKVLIGLLRVCDTVSPYMKQIWMNEHGETKDRHNMKSTIESAFVALRELSAANDIDLADAMQATADKLDTRDREPHVIEEDRDRAKVEAMLTSGRERSISALSKYSLQTALLHEIATLRKVER